MSHNHPKALDCYQESQKLPWRVGTGENARIVFVLPTKGKRAGRYPLPVPPSQQHNANERRRTRGW